MRFTLVFFSMAFYVASSYAVLPNRKTSAAAVKTYGISAPLYHQTELLFGMGSILGNLDSTPAGQKAEYNGFALSANYAYGLSDSVSLYVNQTYTNLDIALTNPTSSYKTSGLGDTRVGVKGVINFDKSYFYCEGSYTTGLAGKAKLDTTAGSTTESAVSTRSKMTLTGGGGIPIRDTSVGAQLAYTLFQDGDREISRLGVSTTEKNKSGTGLAWKVYGQLEMVWKAGLSYEESKTDEYNVISSGMSSITKDSTNTQVTAYGIIPFGNANELMIAISKFDNKEATKTKYNLYGIELMYRKIF